jgi:polyisoprenoid-binding protein YceI
MKRGVLGVFVAMFALAVLYGSNTNAVNRTFEERFAVPNGESGTYNFDRAHSFISFTVKHNGLIYVPGFFRDFTGAVNYDAKDVSKSSVTFTAKATSIDTGNTGRDTHLRSKDFFEVETYPELTFKSTKVETKGKQMIVTGDLTMKGVTKSISIPFNIPGFVAANQRTGPRMGIVGETNLNRRDFNITYGNNIPGTTVPVIADDVQIRLQIEAVQPRATPAATPTPAE